MKQVNLLLVLELQFVVYLHFQQFHYLQVFQYLQYIHRLYSLHFQNLFSFLYDLVAAFTLSRFLHQVVYPCFISLLYDRFHWNGSATKCKLYQWFLAM